jgi:TM2 domain-containing membrane protein YozV
MASRKDPSLATILTIFIPGFAHFYNDRVGEGILFFFIVPPLYFVIIGFFLHLYLIFTAGGMTKETNVRNGYMN